MKMTSRKKIKIILIIRFAKLLMKANDEMIAKILVDNSYCPIDDMADDLCIDCCNCWKEALKLMN